jgi:O-antigen/teichoic acid export membrane protein
VSGAAGGDALAALRSNRLRGGLATGIIARVIYLAGLLLVARWVVGSHGAAAWGLLALAAALLEVALNFDLSVQDVAAYEVVTAETVAGAQRRVDQVMVVALGAALAGALALAGAALAAPSWAPEPAMGALLWATAATYPLLVIGNVYAGTLEGLGWIRELNWSVIATAAFDLGAVALCLWLDTSLAVLLWVRGARGLFRVGVLLVLVHGRRLPVARPRWLSREELARLLRYAAGYTATRGLGTALYKAPVGLAPGVTTVLHVGALDAADQLASLAYRSSHLLYENLFARFARALRAGSQADERLQGRAAFETSTFGLTALLLPCVVGLGAMGPTLLRGWLGTQLETAESALPWLTLAWMVNAAGGMSTCLLLASGRNGPSVRVHLLAAAVMVAGVWVFRGQGAQAPVWSAVLANVVLVVGLVAAATRLAELPLAPVLVRLVAAWALAAILLALLPAALPARLALVVPAALGGIALVRSHRATCALLRREH